MSIRAYQIGSPQKRGEGPRVGAVRFLPRGVKKQDYAREMEANTDSRQVIRFVAKASLRTAISVGCYCADESHCHRSVLRKLIRKAQKVQ